MGMKVSKRVEVVVEDMYGGVVEVVLDGGVVEVRVSGVVCHGRRRRPPPPPPPLALALALPLGVCVNSVA
tara:strand:+ start:871 stop:1080 length:210 start_codon:yes stop_codon:yes gene_type:complete